VAICVFFTAWKHDQILIRGAGPVGRWAPIQCTKVTSKQIHSISVSLTLPRGSRPGFLKLGPGGPLPCRV